MTALTLIRHATILLELAGQTFLVDPMLDDARSHDAVEGTSNPTRWPLVGLPTGAAEVVASATAVLITHTHVDHLDDTAIAFLRDRSVPVFCQPFDVAELTERGLPDVRPVDEVTHWRGVAIRRTGGQHGTGAQADLMGPVSGWLLTHGGQQVYVAGDTVWCDEVAAVLDVNQPQVVVVNAGEARMVTGDPITMGADDVFATCRYPGRRQVIAVHLEALNHCGLTRAELACDAAAAGLEVTIPRDGERVSLFQG
ncbi:MBL fold metallo-hydrolase [Kribbella solani]|uniref:L-ascorbate metabolism protein UlaG (Beta-lactamase superfamily) n=1 Tax=Kribbella solani TaxID=236067 RepID=A0A841DZX6_9ACTN|nr:MBL fold metallo-hydrolase [Kribbella solani]MBB5983729.1 L-ascorbate metabolism protein UlaG (beta-lactamase superfamily) [Kribbella solani]